MRHVALIRIPTPFYAKHSLHVFFSCLQVSVEFGWHSRLRQCRYLYSIGSTYSRFFISYFLFIITYIKFLQRLFFRAEICNVKIESEPKTVKSYFFLNMHVLRKKVPGVNPIKDFWSQIILNLYGVPQFRLL